MIWKDMIIGGTVLSLGSSAIGRLPTSGAQEGVQSGLSAAGGFFPMMGTIGGASMVMNQLKNLKGGGL